MEGLAFNQTRSDTIFESDRIEIDRGGRISGSNVSLFAGLVVLVRNGLHRIGQGSTAVLVSKGEGIAMLLNIRQIGIGDLIVANSGLREGNTGESNTGKKGDNAKGRFNGHFNNLLKILNERALARSDNGHVARSLQ